MCLIEGDTAVTRASHGAAGLQGKGTCVLGCMCCPHLPGVGFCRQPRGDVPEVIDSRTHSHTCRMVCLRHEHACMLTHAHTDSQPKNNCDVTGTFRGCQSWLQTTNAMMHIWSHTHTHWDFLTPVCLLWGYSGLSADLVTTLLTSAWLIV